MTRQVLEGSALLPEGIRHRIAITIDNGVIVDVAERQTIEVDDESLIVPGFIDSHVHGGAGTDFMDATPEAVEGILRFHARQGTASLAATTLSGSPQALALAVRRIAEAKLVSDGAEVVGIHLEGPYINPARAGAQDRGSIRPGDVHELASLLACGPDLPWIVTIAPEAPGVLSLLEAFRDRATFSIGHSNATYAECLDAVRRGAKHFTHLFNAMTGLGHREPGAVGAALISGHTTAEIIADGVHVHHAVLGLIARMMPGRLSLVTDAMRACGMPDGSYKLYDYDVIVADGAARLPDGTLAGSVLTMRQAVQNMVELAGVTLDAAVRMATEVPARLLGIAARKGRIEVGYDADLVVLSKKIEIERLFLRGTEIELS